ncbi:MAG: 30S ribosomal protein S2 [SAR324 cluster bacterium]|nr:30S ribosomal protein S2 [SAR324 cluster bacterium]
MDSISVKTLVGNGVHFGHITSKWHPKMRPYIYGVNNRSHILDSRKTLIKLREAYEYAASIGASGGKIFYVGTKKLAADIIQLKAAESNNYYVNFRWLGGTLTNFQTIRQTLLKLKRIEGLATNDLSYPDIIKKEAVSLEKERQKLVRLLGGFREMKKMPSALFIVDINKERIAVKESRILGIPIIAMIDSNSDPRLVDYQIPSNDDSLSSIELVTSVITQGYMEGKKFAEQQKSVKIAKLATEDKAKSDAAAATAAAAPTTTATGIKVKMVDKLAGSDAKKLSVSKESKENVLADKKLSSAPAAKAKPASITPKTSDDKDSLIKDEPKKAKSVVSDEKINSAKNDESSSTKKTTSDDVSLTPDVATSDSKDKGASSKEDKKIDDKTS